MTRISKSKQLTQYLIQRVVVLEENMRQWAAADEFLGMELMFRARQVAALKAGDTETAVEIHEDRIKCLEEALEVLRNCPACGPHEEAKEE